MSGSPRQMRWDALAYAARVSAALVAVGWYAVRGVSARLGVSEGVVPWHGMMVLVGQMDLLHAVFLALLAMAGLLLALSFVRWRRWAGPVLWAPPVLMAAAGWWISTAPDWARVMAPRWDYRLACALAAVNGVGLVWLGVERDRRSWPRRAVIWAAGAADLLVPLWVWAIYRGREARGVGWWRPAAILLALAPAGLVWLLHPVDLATPLRETPRLRQMVNGTFYQTIVDQTDGTVIAIKDAANAFFRLDPQRPHPPLKELYLPQLGQFQAVAWDAERRKILVLDQTLRRGYRIDAAIDGVEADWPIEGIHADPIPNCRTIWRAEAKALMLFCPDGLSFYCPDGRRVTHRVAVYPGQIVFDRRRREAIAVGWDEQLPFFSVSPPAIARSIAKPYFTERGAIDAADDRLYVTVPLESRVLAVDLSAPAVVGSYASLPGVRVPEVDEATHHLLLAGFASILEVVSLPSLRVVDRVAAPPWARSITIDDAHRVAYVTSNEQGVWRVDLARVGGAWRTWLARLDPFFPLVRLAGKAAMILVRHTAAPPPSVPLRMETVDPAPCGPGTWLEN